MPVEHLIGGLRRSAVAQARRVWRAAGRRMDCDGEEDTHGALPTTPQRQPRRRLSTTPVRTPQSAPRSARQQQDAERDRVLLGRLQDNDPALTTLWLADGELDEEALSALLAGVRTNTSLKRLYLHGKCLSAAAIEELVDALLQNHGTDLPLPIAPTPLAHCARTHGHMRISCARVCGCRALLLRSVPADLSWVRLPARRLSN